MSMTLVFEAGYDMADVSGGLVLAFVETGGQTFDVTISADLWFLSVDGSTLTDGIDEDGYHAHLVSPYGSLLDEIVSQANAAGDATYTATFDDTTERVTIAGAGGAVTAISITPTTNGGLIGLTGVVSGALSHECQRVPDYVIATAEGFWGQNWTGEYEGGEDVAYGTHAHDGTPGGAAKEDAPIFLDFDIPTEPVERVGNMAGYADADAPWTWRNLWRHCRNSEPIAMRDDTGLTYALLLRPEATKFAPRKLGQGYVARWDLDFETQVLAKKSGS